MEIERLVLGPSLLVITLVACGGWSTPEPEVPETPYERRHVLLLTVDTLRYDHLSVNGHPAATSPALDGLMKRGVIFDRALAPMARTTPSLTTVLTGRYPKGHRVRTLAGRLDKSIPTLATAAKKGGYSTVAVVTNKMLNRKRGLARGFDVYDASRDDRNAAATTAAAIEQLAKIDDDDKAFVWVHYIDPHMPYRPAPELADAFDPEYDGKFKDGFGDFHSDVGHTYPIEYGKRKAVFHNPLDEATTAHVKKLYAADVRGTDDAIADLLAFVGERFGDDWTIVFTSDHGESQGEHDYYWDHGDYVWMPGLHVPLSVTLPAADPLYNKARNDQWVSLADVAPTLIELMDLDWNSPVEGRSLVPAISGERLVERPVFAEAGRSFFFDEVIGRSSNDVAGRFRTVIVGDHKLIWSPRVPETEYRLFDLSSDPNEQTDIAADHSDVVEKLRGHLDRWVAGAEVEPISEPDGDDIEQLKAMGYIEDED